MVCRNKITASGVVPANGACHSLGVWSSTATGACAPCCQRPLQESAGAAEGRRQRAGQARVLPRSPGPGLPLWLLH